MSDFPREADKFKMWADAECPKWPMELTAKAYEAWRAMEGHSAFPRVAVDEFAAAFADYRAANKGA